MAEASDDACLQVAEMGFALYFQEYKKEEHEVRRSAEKFWILWKEDSEEPEHPPGFLCSRSELKEKIKVLLDAFIDLSYLYPSFLVQFWEPVLIEGRTLLTTRHQPFAISSPSEGLYLYRIVSESSGDFYVDKWQIEDELGLLGRVFIHKLPEISPNIEYYSIKEYPQRRDALVCQIKWVSAYPVLDPSRQSCIGVLEMAWPRESGSPDYPYEYLRFPEDVDLKIGGLDDRSYRQIGDDYEAFEAASEEIKEVLEKVCRAYNLLAQTWIVRSDCMSNASYTGQLLSATNLPRYPPDDDYDDVSLEICDSVHLRGGQGIVWQALSSHGLIFCSDITQLSIAEYPLAHFAKLHELRRSFAICLQSSHTKDQLFVLEFFLPSSPKDHKSVKNLLLNLLFIMELNFKTFKLASGKDWGEKLPIQFVDYRNGEKYCYTLGVESQITRSLQSPPGTLQGEGEIKQQDPSSQQLVDKAANAEQSNNNCTPSRGNGTSKNLKRPQSTTGIQLNLNDILPHANKKIADAAEALSVSRSTLKRICREHNINRWPPRNIKENCFLTQGNDDGQQILHLSYGMPSSSNQVLPTIAPTNSHDTMIPDVNFVKVKAKYRDDVIKFKLPLSSKLAELQHEIAKRLKLTGGTFDIKYEDEEHDLVLITCDEDVQDWIHTYGSQGSNSLKVLLMPK